MKKSIIPVLILLCILIGCRHTNQTSYEPFGRIPEDSTYQQYENTMVQKPIRFSEQSMETSDRKGSIGYCGQPTRNGKPCKRRVRGGGPCWQHK